jgi:hypothetical protein
MSNELVKLDLDEQIDNKMSGRPCKYDWPTMKADYLTNRHLTLLDISEKYGASYISVKNRSAQDNWGTERAALNREFVKSTAEASLKKQAKTALQFNENVLGQAMSLLESLKEEHDRLKAMGELDAGRIAKLASGLDITNKTGRLALGLSTSSSEMTGKDGKPLMGEGERTVDDVNAELIALLGEEKYNAIYGEVKKHDE